MAEMTIRFRPLIHRVAHFVLQNTASNSAKKKNRSNEGVAEGGFKENSVTPERIQKADSPAVLLAQSRTPHKSFLFLLEEKIERSQIKKYKENFFTGWRALASDGGAERQSSQSGFSSKKVLTSSKRHRQLLLFIGEDPNGSNPRLPGYMLLTYNL